MAALTNNSLQLYMVFLVILVLLLYDKPDIVTFLHSQSQSHVQSKFLQWMYSVWLNLFCGLLND